MNRFDFEQQYMECWNVTSDLSVLIDTLSEDQTLDKEKILAILRGMKELYELKFDRGFQTFEAMIDEQAII